LLQLIPSKEDFLGVWSAHIARIKIGNNKPGRVTLTM
jgi:hypothetical protein